MIAGEAAQPFVILESKLIERLTPVDIVLFHFVQLIHILEQNHIRLLIVAQSQTICLNTDRFSCFCKSIPIEFNLTLIELDLRRRAINRGILDR